MLSGARYPELRNWKRGLFLTDGPSLEAAGIMLDHVNGCHETLLLVSFGCKFIERRGSIHVYVLGSSQAFEEGSLVWGEA